MNRASLLAAASAIGVALPACSAAPSDAPASEPVASAASEITTFVTASDAIARAEEWVAAQVPYCQSANHQPDPDPSCSATCTRPDNPLWDPYRSDCSGLVSWAWGLAAPGRVTWELAPAQTDITHTIDATTLAPGDAVNKPHDHTMLFKAWVTPGKTATFIEEPGCSANPPYAHEFDSDVTMTGSSITVAYNGITFDAIRYDALLPDEAGAPATDASSSDGASVADGASPDAGAVADDAGPAGEDAAAPGALEAGSGGGAVKAGVDPQVGTSAGCSASRAHPGNQRGSALLLLGVALLLRRRARVRAS